MARNTKADGNSLRSVSTPAMQGKKGNVNSKGRSVTGGASMGGMNIRAAGGLGKSKPKNVELVVKKYKKQVSSDRKSAAKERAGMRAKGIKYEELKSFSGFLDEASNPEGKSAAAKTFSKKKSTNPSDRVQTRQHTSVGLAAEETYDHIKDRRLEKYGIGHDGSDRKSTPSRSSDKKPKGKTVLQKETEKKYGKGKSALDIVKAKITAKHGKGAIMKNEEFVPIKSFKQVANEAVVTGTIAATAAVAKGVKAAVVGAKVAKGAAVAAKGAAAVKGGAAAAKGAGAAAGATKAVGGAAAKKATVAGTTAGSSSKTAGFGQKLGNAAKEGAKDAAVDHVKDKVRKAAGPKEEDTNEEVINELSADTLSSASKAADVDRGKKAVAGDKEGAKKRVKQASKFYKAAGAKRKEEATEEYEVTNADKKGNTPAYKAFKAGKKNAKTGKPLYKAADHMKEGAATAEAAKKEAVLKSKEDKKVAEKKALAGVKEGHGYWDYHEKEGLKRFTDFIQEGNPTTRMMNKSSSQQTGNISADRGSDVKKNRESRKGLEKDLKKKGIGYKKGTGEYKYDSGEKGREVSYQTSPGKGMSKRKFGKVMRRLGRKHGQETVITKDKDKPARLHDTESKKPGKSVNIGKTKAGKHPDGAGETSGTKVRSSKLSKKTNKPSYHYG